MLTRIRVRWIPPPLCERVTQCAGNGHASLSSWSRETCLARPSLLWALLNSIVINCQRPGILSPKKEPPLERLFRISLHWWSIKEGKFAQTCPAIAHVTTAPGLDPYLPDIMLYLRFSPPKIEEACRTVGAFCIYTRLHMHLARLSFSLNPAHLALLAIWFNMSGSVSHVLSEHVLKNFLQRPTCSPFLKKIFSFLLKKQN